MGGGVARDSRLIERVMKKSLKSFKYDHNNGGIMGGRRRNVEDLVFLGQGNRVCKIPIRYCFGKCPFDEKQFTKTLRTVIVIHPIQEDIKVKHMCLCDIM